LCSARKTSFFILNGVVRFSEDTRSTDNPFTDKNTD